MGFNNIWFVLFLPLVVSIYYLLPNRFRWVLLNISSYFFYGFVEPKFMVLMGGITLIAYVFGRVLNYNKSKTIASIGVLLVISFLLFFKYSTWLFHITNDILVYFDFSTLKLGWVFDNIVLPIGISFYTFQAISYIIDVYKSRINAEKHLGYFSLYISFFPQLVAGPIEKPGYLIPLFKKNHKLTWNNFSEGSKLLLIGFFKKIVIAESLFPFVSDVFSRLDSLETSGFEVWLGLLAYIYYLYNDFSAYCDIALGAALYFGIPLSQNFFKPFSSINFRQFWNKWHATLSIWVKTYVFTPLGGIVRRNRLRTLFNVFLSFAIIGVWHGASFNFLFFGFLAGFYVVLDYATKNVRLKFFKKFNFTKKYKFPRIVFKITSVLMFQSLGIFFFTKDFNEAYIVFTKIIYMFTDFHIKLYTFLVIAILICVTEIINYCTVKNEKHPFNFIKNDFLRIISYSLVIIVILMFVSNSSTDFYYLRF